jgi:hypothetical protein
MMRLPLLGVLVIGLTSVAVAQRGHENDSVPERSQAIAALALLAGTTLILKRKK